MQAVWCRDPLGPGSHVVSFEGVQREANGAFDRPCLVWTFSNDSGTARIVSGVNFSISSSAGKLLSIISGIPAKVGVAVDISDFAGKNFTVEIQQVGDKRTTRIVAAGGNSIAVNDDGE